MAAPKPNLLDRVIEAVAPRMALQRLRARGALALSGGYFGGAARGRAALSNWNPGVADADGDISPDLVDLRGYSRDLARRSALAGGAVSTVVTNVVGTGLAVQPAPDAAVLKLSESAAQAWAEAALREWRLWAEGTDCDITRTQNFYGLTGLAFRSVLESGDTFVLPTMAGTGRPYRLALQLIEADRICNEGHKADSATLVAGVELSASGAPIRYHIANGHPGARLRGGMSWTKVPAFGERSGRRNVLHLFDRRRPGQSRGVPYLAPVIEPLKQLQRYSEAEISAAVISAAFAVFVKMDAEAFESLFAENERSTYLKAATKWDGSVPVADMSGPGRAVNLLPGESIESPDLGRPNSAFDPFVQAVLRQVGVGLEMPFEVLIKHFTASYSASRAALLDAWRFFRGRRDWIVTAFCQPVYELWLEEAVAQGRISAPGFFADPAIRRAWCAAVWTGDGPGSIDPVKEVNAARERIDLGISTIAAEAILHDGIDWQVKHTQRTREVAARRAAGLEQAAVAPANPDDDPDDEGEDTPPPPRNGPPPTPNPPPQPNKPPRRTGSADLVAALAVATDAVIAQNHDATLAEQRQILADHLAKIDARLTAAQQAPQVTVNVAPTEAPSVQLEAIHHHHIAVAAAESVPAQVQIDVHVPPAAAPVVNLEAVLPAPDVTLAWPTRETRTTIVRDAAGDMTGSTAIEKSVD